MCDLTLMMRLTPTALLALAAILTAGFVVTPASADPRHCPPGLARKNPPCIPPGHAGRRDGRWDDDRRWDDDHHHDGEDDGYRHRRRDSGYDEAYREGYRDGYRVAVGDRLTSGDYALVNDPRRYGLMPYGQDAWRYYLVRDMIVRADPDTRRVLSIIGLADALLN
jgi:hypothetical protein